ncbi:hypothetical protein [Nannocystis pusilla]|uniref:Uncharacterized protein n=1 Tax=Nannocystis pusilla TaxID=889268 RepID=A0ABS7TU04_9BACT|nr:hypothetical protein [Nannocystis pusilla]MBZ5711541.1 hypothetical protein [Nannocystis pusilla]
MHAQRHGDAERRAVAAAEQRHRALAEEAPIVLLALDSGERWPYFADVDTTGVAGEPQTIFIRPMRRLRTGTRDVVAVRGLRDKNGEEIPASPLFRALRDE